MNGWIDVRSVYIIMAYQHDIIGLQLILLAFDPVGDTAPYEDDNLIKIMVVIFKILFFGIGQMEQPEVAV